MNKELDEVFANLGIEQIQSEQEETDLIKLGLNAEEIVALLVCLKEKWKIEIRDFIGDFPITYRMLEQCIDETNHFN